MPRISELLAHMLTFLLPCVSKRSQIIYQRSFATYMQPAKKSPALFPVPDLSPLDQITPTKPNKLATILS